MSGEEERGKGEGAESEKEEGECRQQRMGRERTEKGGNSRKILIAFHSLNSDCRRNVRR